MPHVLQRQRGFGNVLDSLTSGASDLTTTINTANATLSKIGNTSDLVNEQLGVIGPILTYVLPIIGVATVIGAAALLMARKRS